MHGLDRPSLTNFRGQQAGVSEHQAALEAWRRRSSGDQAWSIWGDDRWFEPRLEADRRRVRVGFWCPCLGLGGAEAWQLALAKAVDPSRITWAGAVVTEGRSAIESAMAAELGTLMPVGFGLDAARKLGSACDVIVSWAVVDVGRLLSGLEAPPALVMACHFPGESPWGEGTSELLRGVDRFVAVSELALEAMPTALRVGARVIWNAVDADRLRIARDRKTIRAEWGVPPEAPVVGYLGRLAPEKDPAALIRLAAALSSDWHAVLVGEGRERAALERDAARLAPGRVHVLRGDSAAGDVLNGFDSLIVPSRYESFGLTLAEGLWSGVPVIATRTGVAKIVPGLVREVPVAASGRTLARAVMADREHPDGTRERVDRARRFALDRLGLDRFGRQWTDLLIELADHRKEEGSCPSTHRRA